MGNFKVDETEYDDQTEYIKTGSRCGTPHAGYHQIRQIDAALISFRNADPKNARFSEVMGSIVIKIRFVHICDGEEGKVTATQRAEQVRVLNEDYSPHRIQFTYAEEETEMVDNPYWFRMGHNSAAERQAKTQLQVSPETILNFYTAGFPLRSRLLGWATFPNDFAGDPVKDGVVLRYGTLPGGSSTPYNLGRTATHELGHWLGLFHTFQGRCDGIGDHVGDTEPHSGPNHGTPKVGEKHNACAEDGISPVQNFMNYTDDDWMTHFTDKQGSRMREQIALFRPDLLQDSAEEAEMFERVEIKNWA